MYYIYAMRKKKRKNSSLPEILAVVALIAVTCYYAFAGRSKTVNAQEESMKLITAVEELRDAQKEYFSRNKKYSSDLADLIAISGEKLSFIPPATVGTAQSIAVKEGWDYEIRIYSDRERYGVSALYAEGRFKNSGFFYNFKGINDEPAGELMCKEPLDVPRSDYCKNIMGYSKLFSYRPQYRVYRKTDEFEDITGGAEKETGKEAVKKEAEKQESGKTEKTAASK